MSDIRPNSKSGITKSCQSTNFFRLDSECTFIFHQLLENGRSYDGKFSHIFFLQYLMQNQRLALWFKGTNGRQKTYEIFNAYCIVYSGVMCQTTVIFGITKDGSLVLNTLASWNCFICRNLFQNGAKDISEYLTCETAFCKKSSKFGIVRIIRFWSETCKSKVYQNFG